MPEVGHMQRHLSCIASHFQFHPWLPSQHSFSCVQMVFWCDICVIFSPWISKLHRSFTLRKMSLWWMIFCHLFILLSFRTLDWFLMFLIFEVHLERENFEPYVHKFVFDGITNNWFLDSVLYQSHQHPFSFIHVSC